MILRIIAYGDQLLRKKSTDISPDYPGLDKLIEDMFETMYNSNGVGLAAPQTGLNIRLIVIDSNEILKDQSGLKKAFINPFIIETSGEDVSYEEGCLSLPKIREDVIRPENVRLKYLDENFVEHTETFSGITARVIQHEYDHLEGILFIDRLSFLKKNLIKKKLNNILSGNVDVDYPIKLPGKMKKK